MRRPLRTGSGHANEKKTDKWVRDEEEISKG